MNGWRTLFPNAWIIAQKEYRGAIRGKGFIIGTVILAALAFVATQAPTLIEKVAGGGHTRVAVVDTAQLPASSVDVLSQALNGGPTMPSTGGYALSLFDTQAAADQARQNGNADGVLVIARDPSSKDLSFQYRADTEADGRTATMLKSAASTLAQFDRLARAGIAPKDYYAPVAFSVVSPKTGVASGTDTSTKTVASTVNEEVSRSLVNTGLVVLIFMAIVTYGVWVAMSVAEEKGSRVMELMLNAVTPLQMLTGKVIGTGAAGLTQYGLVILAMLAGILAQNPIRTAILGESSGDGSLPGLTPGVLGAFVVLLLLGFLLYSLLYAALGSLVSRQEDVQSATGPLMMLVMVGYFASLFASGAVDEAWVKVLSLVPFFTPYMMLTRLLSSTVQPWEFALAVAIMLATSAVALWVAARIYSAGVLLYGQRVSIRTVLKAARVAR